MRTSMIANPTPPALIPRRVRSWNRFFAAIETISCPLVAQRVSSLGSAAEVGPEATERAVPTDSAPHALHDFRPFHPLPPHIPPLHRGGPAIGFRLPCGRFTPKGSFN